MEIILSKEGRYMYPGAYKSKVVLAYDNWDDFGYKTSFSMYYYDETKDVHEIGSVKIYCSDCEHNKNKQTIDYLQKHIWQLGEKFCSLGQDLIYYQNLEKNLPNDYKDILGRLNDMAFRPNVMKRFLVAQGVKISLLRFSSAEKALTEMIEVMHSGTAEDKDISFGYRADVPYSEVPVSLQFDFKKTANFPYRINILIGKNGAGKTHILAELANSLSGYTDQVESGKFIEKRPAIDRVMSISYSAFDRFRKPPNRSEKDGTMSGSDRTMFSYVYCGLQEENGPMSLPQLKENLKRAYLKIKERGRRDTWLKVLSEIMEAEHKRTIELISEERFEDINLSSGQQILICTMTDLIANIENESIILFDEPEIHLHPNAISNMLRMFYRLLDEFNSYAIFATHSPLIIQEVPSRYIQILNRIDDVLVASRPEIECFGSNINKIIREVFNVTAEESNFKGWLTRLSKNRSFEEIVELFEGNLDMNALIYLKSCYKAEG